jgi:hypothetical protein
MLHYEILLLASLKWSLTFGSTGCRIRASIPSLSFKRSAEHFVTGEEGAFKRYRTAKSLIDGQDKPRPYRLSDEVTMR